MIAKNTDKTPLIKEEILTTQARKLLFDSLMQGFSVKESAKKAKIGYEYARKLCSGSGRYGTTDVNINALVNQEMAIISQKVGEKLEITKERQLKEYEDVKVLAVVAGEYSAAKGCLDSQSRIIGAFAEDNTQQQGLSLVDIVAIVGRRAIESREVPVLPGSNAQGVPLPGRNEEGIIDSGEPVSGDNLHSEANNGQQPKRAVKT